MDQVMKQAPQPVTFNGPLEAGMRAVAILAAAYPQTYDLQRLVAFDYLLVHTGDIGGPRAYIHRRRSILQSCLSGASWWKTRSFS